MAVIWPALLAFSAVHRTGVRLVFWDALVAVVMDIPPAGGFGFQLMTHDDCGAAICMLMYIACGCAMIAQRIITSFVQIWGQPLMDPLSEVLRSFSLQEACFELRTS
jgi:hypothetical protein